MTLLAPLLLQTCPNDLNSGRLAILYQHVSQVAQFRFAPAVRLVQARIRVCPALMRIPQQYLASRSAAGLPRLVFPLIG